MTVSVDVDVVIVGAGLSGLAAARRLREKGVDCVVLEARDRVGGRTKRVQVGDVSVDVGAQWVAARHQRVLELAAELNLETFPTFHHGRKVLDLSGTVSTSRSATLSLSLWNLFWLQRAVSLQDSLRRKVPLDAPWEADDAAAWDSTTVEDFKRRVHMPGPVTALFDTAVRAVMGAEPHELTLLHFLFYMNSNGGLRRVIEVEGGARERRFVDGASSLALKMAEGQPDDVVLSAPVRQIRQSDAVVVITSDAGQYCARYAIVATPPMAALEIDFQPALPPSRAGLLRAMRSGYTATVNVLYRTSFWRRAGLSGEAVCTEGPVTYFIDNTDHEGHAPCLLGVLAGAPGRAASRLAPDARRAAILAQLARYFGADALEPVDYLEFDWQDEPWTCGGPVATIAPKWLSEHGAALREPCGRIHWAGTETAVDFCGYMEGALEAGVRAADEIIAAL